MSDGRAIVFDLDGTLIDSAPDIQGIANHLLAREGRPPLTLPEVHGFIGHGAGTFVQRMRAARGLAEADHDRLLAEFIAAYDDAVHLTTVYPGVPQALQALSAAGWRLAVCTNKPERAARAVLRHLHLLDRFGAVIGGDSTPARKPDPAPLLAAFAALGAGQPRLYVGDSDVDAETARAAGLPFLLFTEGYRHGPAEALPHAAAFADFAALPGLVAGMVPRLVRA